MCAAKAWEGLIAHYHQQWLPRVPDDVDLVSKARSRCRWVTPVPLWLMNAALTGAQPTCPASRQTHGGSGGRSQPGGPTGRPRCVTARGRAWLPPVQRERLGWEQEGRPPPTGPWVPGAQPACGGGGSTHSVTVTGAWSARAAYPPRTNQGTYMRSLPVLFRRHAAPSGRVGRGRGRKTPKGKGEGLFGNGPSFWLRHEWQRWVFTGFCRALCISWR